MKFKDIAATLAILGSGALVMTGCGKEQPATEVPAGDEAAPTADAEASCAADDHPDEGHCGGDDEAGDELDAEADDAEAGDDEAADDEAAAE